MSFDKTKARELDARIQADLKPEEYKRLMEASTQLRLLGLVLPIMLDKHWPEYWEAMKAEIEDVAGIMLNKKDEKKRAGPSLFG